MSENENLIVLIDDEGQPVNFEHLMTLKYKEKEYIVMHPVDDPEVDEGEVVIFAVVDEDGEESFVPVEDEDLAQSVFDEFLLILESEEED